MLKNISSTVVALFFAGWLTGCTTLQLPEINDTPSLMKHLDQEGLSLLAHGPIIQPMISTPGHEFTVTTGGVLQVYEYTNGAAVLQDLSLLEGDRDLFRAPHLYRRDNLVVIYFGNDPKVERVLSDVLGPRIS